MRDCHLNGRHTIQQDLLQSRGDPVSGCRKQQPLRDMARYLFAKLDGDFSGRLCEHGAGHLPLVELGVAAGV